MKCANDATSNDMFEHAVNCVEKARQKDLERASEVDGASYCSKKINA